MKTNNNYKKIGSYAVSNIDLDTWMTQQTAPAVTRSKKTRAVKEIVNKIFSDCALVTNDPFWKDKFTTAAIGKLPRGFSFHDGFLFHKKGAKTQQIEVSNNPYEAAPACAEFFRIHGGIFSPSDEQISLELQYARSQAVLTQEKLTWANSNKKIQEALISHYVETMKKTMQLNNLEMEQLRQTIKLGIANKFFGKDNIDVQGNRIFLINGLLWNNDKRIFYIDPSLKPALTRNYTRNKDGPPPLDPSQKDMIPQFGVKWQKYIEIIEKKHDQRLRRSERNHIKNSNQSYFFQPNTATDITSTGDTTNNDDDDDDDY